MALWYSFNSLKWKNGPGNVDVSEVLCLVGFSLFPLGVTVERYSITPLSLSFHTDLTSLAVRSRTGEREAANRRKFILCCHDLLNVNHRCFPSVQFERLLDSVPSVNLGFKIDLQNLGYLLELIVL